jgi:hypothetical protein
LAQEQRLIEQFPGVVIPQVARDIDNNTYTLQQARLHHKTLLQYLDQCGNKDASALSKHEQASRANALRLVNKLEAKFPAILKGG